LMARTDDGPRGEGRVEGAQARLRVDSTPKARLPRPSRLKLL